MAVPVAGRRSLPESANWLQAGREMQGITARCESVYDSIDIPRAAMLRRNSPCLQSAEYDPTGATRASALPHKNELARSQVLVGQALLPVQFDIATARVDRQ